MEVKYDFEKEIDVNEVLECFRTSGINRALDDPERTQEMIKNSDLIATARVDGKLVGIARVISDYAYCAYLSDLAVDKDFQRMSIGKELIRLVQEKLGERVTLILVSAPSAVDYYPRLGFEKIDKAFWVRRKK